MRKLKITQSITNRDSGKLMTYMKEINKIPIPDFDEEVILARKIRENVDGARDRLVMGNLRFVISIAKKFQNRGVPLLDLVSSGNIGLINAAEKFDETRGFKFISYAVWWIRQSICCHLLESGRMIRLPGNKVVDLTSIKKASALFEAINERLPTYEELSYEIGLSPDKIADCLLNSQLTYSLDIRSEETDCNLTDMLINTNSPAPDSFIIHQSFKDDIERILSILPSRKRMIIKMFFGIDQTPLTLEDICIVLDRSKERTRQLKDEALKTLRLYLKKNRSSFNFE